MLMARSLLPLPAVLLCACLVTTDEDAWKDGAVQPDQETADQATADQAEADAEGDADGPTADGPGPDAPLPDLAPWDGMPPDQNVPVDLPPNAEGNLPLGSPCGAGGQCQSGQCADGVCCDSPCTGPCVACDLVSPGTCAPAPAGTDPGTDCTQDPVATCGLDGTCDGSGGCRKYPVGTVCGGSCPATERSRVDACDSTGTCAPGTEIDCSPFACDAATGQCFTSCTADLQCYRFACNTATSQCHSTCSTVAECQPGLKCNPQGKCV